MIEYVHPAFMTVTLGLVFLALRHGLVLRRGRFAGAAGGRARREHRARHLRLGKLAVGFVFVGFAGGVATTTWLQGERPIATFHGLLGGLSLLAFGSLAVLGRRLERGDASAREAHAWAAFAAVLCAGTGAVAGFVLLP